MTLCPCCSTLDYLTCCGPFINHEKTPDTPEKLMRSRYTAYSLVDTAYIKKTMQGKAAYQFDEDQAKAWAKRVNWIGLQIVQSSLQGETSGQVEFIASFIEHGKLKTIHENSTFHRQDNHWLYVDGTPLPSLNQPISRNAPCPCGSLKKFKNCHGG